MEALHKIFVNIDDQIRVIKACMNEEYPGMHYIDYDKLVNESIKTSAGATMFKIENIHGALVGYASFVPGEIKELYIRKTFRISSYIQAVKALTDEEILLKTNGSLTYSRNKILN